MAKKRFKWLRKRVFRWRQWNHQRMAMTRISHYIHKHSVRKLQLGSGPTQLTGWLNTTLLPFNSATVYLDATQPFPIPDRSFDYVFSEHMIEHLPFEAGQHTLRESYRILKPGGILRLATPDLAQIMKLYSQPDGEEQQAYRRWIMETFLPDIDSDQPSFVINRSFSGWGHLFIYDRETMTWCLERAGFRDIRWVEPGSSDDPNLTNLENHGNVVGSDRMMRYESMIVEATRF